MNEDTILIGRGTGLSRIPRSSWEEGLLSAPQRIQARLAFMSEDHHSVRNYAVRELPRACAPISPATLSEALGIPLSRTLDVLEDLERHLFFLVRNKDGNVSWAFPFTVETTGHNLVFSTGERLDAA
jgi:hypothetical protein